MKSIRKGTDSTIIIPEEILVENRLALKDLAIQELNVPSHRLILDFSNTRYISSSGLGILAVILEATKEKNASLLLRNIKPEILPIFKFRGLENIFTIEKKAADESGIPHQPTTT
jgi:anti-anti-sigma factor